MALCRTCRASHLIVYWNRRAAPVAPQPPAIPAGYWLAPDEPTGDMIAAAWALGWQDRQTPGFGRAYAAMRAAAPKVDAQPQQEESLPEFLERVAAELVARDTVPGSISHGIAASLRGRAYILRKVHQPKE
jgi:hypothetical protein